MVEAKMIRQSYFTTEARGSAKHLSGNENNSLRKGGESVLTGYVSVRWWWTGCAVKPKNKA